MTLNVNINSSTLARWRWNELLRLEIAAHVLLSRHLSIAIDADFEAGFDQ
jgi:hypothetical protein